MYHHMETPFGHMTLMYISWITWIWYSHTLSLATDEGKLVRNHGLGILYHAPFTPDEDSPVTSCERL